MRIYDGAELIAAQDVTLGAKAAHHGQVEFPAGEAGVRDLRVTLDARRAK